MSCWASMVVMSRSKLHSSKEGTCRHVRTYPVQSLGAEVTHAGHQKGCTTAWCNRQTSSTTAVLEKPKQHHRWVLYQLLFIYYPHSLLPTPSCPSHPATHIAASSSGASTVPIVAGPEAAAAALSRALLAAALITPCPAIYKQGRCRTGRLLVRPVLQRAEHTTRHLMHRCKD
jgi:hypothetical protein